VSGLTRREFLGTSAAAAAAAATSGGLLVGCASSPSAQAAPGAAELGPWIQITPDDRVFVWTDKVEMGQGTMTGYATLIGEELDLDPARIETIHPGVEPRFGFQNTGGSDSMAASWMPLRESAAKARARLEIAAAARFDVPRSELTVDDGRVTHSASGRSLGFGELATAAAALSEPRDVVLKTPDQFRFIGHERPRVDAAAKARGAAQYGLDVRVDGLMHAAVVRPPRRGDRVDSFDANAVLGMPGVSDVFEISSGVAIVAKGTWQARQAASALPVTFVRGEGPRADSDEIRRDQTRLLAEEDGSAARDDGNVDEAYANAAKQLDVHYYTPHQAHAAMEPLNCTIVPQADRVDVHLGTQGPTVAQDIAADILGRSRSEVFVHTSFLGGGFGRRVFPDVVVECAEVVRRTGAPIQLVWSREDDTGHDYYRPATGHRFRGGLDADGEIMAWDHKLVAPSMIPSMGEGMAGAFGPEWMRGFMNAAGDGLMGFLPRLTGPIMSIEGAVEQPYAAESVRVASILHDPGIRVGIWRSVGHSNNGFVVEGFVDELAHAAGQDPLAFRRQRLANHPRHLACLDLVEEEAAWGRPAAGRHQGVAVHESFGSVVAHVAEVSVTGSSIRVERVTAAVHCGRAVNPDVVRAQIEGGTIFGLTAALKSAVTFRDGAAVESNFHDYAMLRMNEAPDIAVHIVPSEAPPSGVGEPGTPGIAAAVANAVFAATGKRLRELPLRLDA
jgi:CO/xanthine dehydrogenase Mo-binding subunit